MREIDSLFLPGVDRAAVLAALECAGGGELASGKFASPESSAALAVNTFGAFLRSPEKLPPLPSLSDVDWPARKVAVERQMRFPWRGGRHPWLDAAVETETHLIGVESKRFEPFRDTKQVSLSAAYDRDWGSGMVPYCRMRDELRSGTIHYRHLDAAQLVKHAYGLTTEAARIGKAPVLLYLFAEPSSRDGRLITDRDHTRHREEIAHFASRVNGAAVRFAFNSYREWLETWDDPCRQHAGSITERFQP